LTPLLIRHIFHQAKGRKESRRLTRKKDEGKKMFGALNFDFEVKEN